MENIPSVFDNLYKVVAIGGIALVITAILAPCQRAESLMTERTRVRGEIGSFNEEVQSQEVYESVYHKQVVNAGREVQRPPGSRAPVEKCSASFHVRP